KNLITFKRKQCKSDVLFNWKKRRRISRNCSPNYCGRPHNRQSFLFTFQKFRIFFFEKNRFGIETNQFNIKRNHGEKCKNVSPTYRRNQSEYQKSVEKNGTFFHRLEQTQLGHDKSFRRKSFEKNYFEFKKRR